MPEIAEVEIMTRAAARWMEGASVLRAEVTDGRVLRSGADMVELLTGARFGGARRRAKHMCLDFDRAELALHFRMTGKWVRAAGVGERAFRLVLVLEGAVVGLVDTRRLAEVRVFPPGGFDRWVGSLGLGPDVYPEARMGAWWAARLAHGNRTLRAALLDQRGVAGVGNILASEICFAAGLHPERRVSSLSPAEWDLLATAAPSQVACVIAAEPGDEIAYVSSGGDNAAFAVYGRGGTPCRRCGALVQRRMAGGRASYACPACQR